MTDPLLNQTNYFYDPVYQGAYLTHVQEPTVNGVAHDTYFGYDFNTGLRTSVKNFNSQITTYSYDTAARLSQITYPCVVTCPDGGQVTFGYSSPSSAPSVTRTQLLTSSLSTVETTIFDALHRVTQTQLTSDPEGTVYVDTTYDALGRKATVGNPHRSQAATTDGVTTYGYDTLGRITSVLEPDNSQASTSYSGKCSTVTGEAGHQRKSCSDALGHSTGVWEAPNITGVNYERDYGYDALGNLTSVTQKGGASSTSWRTRTFTYDSISRLVCAANPEIQAVTCPTSATGTFPTGATVYTYDSDGNVLTRTSPPPTNPAPGQQR